MMKYLPAANSAALKTSLNEAISKNNISSNKIAKAINVNTSYLKGLRDVNNEDMEITPEQYLDLKRYLAPKKIELDLGKDPEGFYEKFMLYLYKHGETVNNFVSKTKINKTNLKKMFTDNGVSYKYKNEFCTILTEKEFDNLNSFEPIILSDERNDKIVRQINSATLINVFIEKRGYDVKNFAKSSGYSVDQVNSILGGFITDSGINKVCKTLSIAETSIDRICLNSMDKENNFGYFLQKCILAKKHNVYSIAKVMNINYCDLKGIVSGCRNIREKEYDIIASVLNLDPYDLKLKAPKIIEGDDKYVIYNFIKWCNEHTDIKLNDIGNMIGITGLTSRINKFKAGKERFNIEIEKLVSLTGLRKDQLRSVLSESEIKQILEFKRPRGAKKRGEKMETKTTKPITTSKPSNGNEYESFSIFIRSKIKKKGYTFSAAASILGVNKNTFATMLYENRLSDEVYTHLKKFLNIKDSDIEKYNITISNKASQIKKLEEKPVAISSTTCKKVAEYVICKIADHDQHSIIIENDNKSKSDYDIIYNNMKTIHKFGKEFMNNNNITGELIISRWRNDTIAADIKEFKYTAEPIDLRLKKLYSYDKKSNKIDEVVNKTIVGLVTNHFKPIILEALAEGSIVPRIIDRGEHFEDFKKSLSEKLKYNNISGTVMIKDVGNNSRQLLISIPDGDFVGAPIDKEIYDIFVSDYLEENKYRELVTSSKEQEIEKLEVVENLDDSSIYPNLMPTFHYNKDKELVDVTPPEDPEVQIGRKFNQLFGRDKDEEVDEYQQRIDEAAKKRITAETDKFLDLFDKLDFDQQINLLKILKITKDKTDQIPEDLLVDNKRAYFKRMNYIIELVEE